VGILPLHKTDPYGATLTSKCTVAGLKTSRPSKGSQVTVSVKHPAVCAATACCLRHTDEASILVDTGHHLTRRAAAGNGGAATGGIGHADHFSVRVKSAYPPDPWDNCLWAFHPLVPLRTQDCHSDLSQESDRECTATHPPAPETVFGNSCWRKRGLADCPLHQT
jgi:hypothetical protein